VGVRKNARETSTLGEKFWESSKWSQGGETNDKVGIKKKPI